MSTTEAQLALVSEAAPEPARPVASNTEALTTALQGHYQRPGEKLPGGVFLTELADEDTGRRVDALHIGFWASQGRRIDGHEVKISRADWLREVADPGKAEAWHRRCHRWWLVVPSLTVAQPDELPEGWGLMVPGSRGRRFRVVKQAVERRPEVDLTLLLVVAKRLDSIRAAAAAERDRAVGERVRAVHEAKRANQRLAEAATEGTLDRLRSLTRIEEALGRPVGWGDVRAEDAAHAMRAAADLSAAARALQQAGRYELQRLEDAYRTATDALDGYGKALARVREIESAPKDPA